MEYSHACGVLIMDDWDMHLEPEEPYKVASEVRSLYCENEDCAVYDEEARGEVEVEYWPHGRAIYAWSCVQCSKTTDTEESVLV